MKKRAIGRAGAFAARAHMWHSSLRGCTFILCTAFKYALLMKVEEWSDWTCKENLISCFFFRMFSFSAALYPITYLHHDTTSVTDPQEYDPPWTSPTGTTPLSRISSTDIHPGLGWELIRDYNFPSIRTLWKSTREALNTNPRIGDMLLIIMMYTMLYKQIREIR